MNKLNRFSNQEDLWSAMLSEEKGKINNILLILSPSEVEFVFNHLNKITTEDGWHPSQQRSAAFALDIMGKKI